MGPVNVRLAKQQGVTPNEKILGCCGEVKCCMRYEHDAYKEFKERAPFSNSTVKLEDREGKVVDYSMVKDSVLVQFGPRRSDQELVSLGAPRQRQPGHRYPPTRTSGSCPSNGLPTGTGRLGP